MQINKDSFNRDEQNYEISDFFRKRGVKPRMGIYAIRALFALIFGGAGWQVGVYLNSDEVRDSLITLTRLKPPEMHWCILAGVGLYLLVLGFELGVGRVPISTLSTVVFGLVVGFLISNLLYSVISLLLTGPYVEAFGGVIKLGLSCIFCYLSVATIYKTRDKFNFIIPYVEFQPERRGPKPYLLDTSSIIDGRIADLAETRLLAGPLLIPRFVVDELQLVADSADRLKRNRGRRGLDILTRLRHGRNVNIEIIEESAVHSNMVDRELVLLAKRIPARIVTCDSPLEKVAQLEGVEALNVNEVANAMRPMLMPGEEAILELTKRGEELGQAIGYLRDGTMVVVENAESRIGTESPIIVTSVLQRPTGRLVFGRLKPLTEHPNQKPDLTSKVGA